MGAKVPWKNKSPTGWWVATLVERFEFEDEDKSNPRRRCRAWSNLVILKAHDRNQAYRKAIRYGELGKEDNDWIEGLTGRKGKLVFEGLADLLPIYDDFDEDGSEILFDDHTHISVARVKSWVKQKKDLKVFDDSES